MVKQTNQQNSTKKPRSQNKKFNQPFKKKPKDPKKPKKAPAVVSPLKQAYTNISRSLANPELLKQRISEFIRLIRDDFLGTLGKLLGSKGLQLVVKYGTPEQRRQVMLMMMSLDVEKVLKGKYSYFFLRKLLSRAKSDKVKTLFLDFFKNNFRKLFKSKQTFKFLNLYVTNVPHSRRLQIAGENLSASFFDEFSFKEFLEELLQKPRLLELEISQFYLWSYFDHIPHASIGPLLGVFLGQLEFIMKADNLAVVLLLNKFFSAVNFKSKKEIMKKCLRDKFWPFYSQNKFFIGFLAHFMCEINDERVLHVTLCKRSVDWLAELMSSVSHSKFLFLVFSKRPEVVFAKEKTLFDATIRKELRVSSLESSPTFARNCQLIRDFVLNSSEFSVMVSFEYIGSKTTQNHQFGLLLGHMLSHLVRLDSASPKIKSIFENLTKSLKTEVDFKASFIGSAAGHRLVKRLIQSMSQAHSEVVSSCQSVLENFVEQCKIRFSDLVDSRGVFVLVSLVENEHFGEEMKEFVLERKQVLEQLDQTGGIKLLLQVIG